jgi:hypothetical protein
MKKLLLTLTGVSMMMTALMAQAPADMEVCAGKGYTLTNAKPAVGAEPITYQWYENSSPIGSGTPALIVAEGRAVADNYTYVRVASNAACTLSSNVYTVRVRAAGAAGQPPDAMCDCASGLIDCSNTCTTPHATEVNGDCNGTCHVRTVNYYTECGVPTGSAGTRTDSNCWQGCPPTRSYLCMNNFIHTANITTDAACEARAIQRATDAGARYYDWSNDSSSPELFYTCSTFYCF